MCCIDNNEIFISIAEVSEISVCWILSFSHCSLIPLFPWSTKFLPSTCLLLWRSASAIAEPLFCLFWNSLLTSCFPSQCRPTIDTLIHKNGDKTFLSNYRPINHASTVSKVLERIFADHILEFAASYHLIPNEQHGFLPGRSTLKDLLVVTGVNHWTRVYRLTSYTWISLKSSIEFSIVIYLQAGSFGYLRWGSYASPAIERSGWELSLWKSHEWNTTGIGSWVASFLAVHF